MNAAELSPLLLAIAAIISALGVPLTAYLAARSVQASARNGAAIADTAAKVQEIEVKVDGRLSALIAALEAQNVLDKAVSFTDGATQQRDAAPGSVVTTDGRLLPAPAAPRRPLSYRPPQG